MSAISTRFFTATLLCVIATFGNRPSSADETRSALEERQDHRAVVADLVRRYCSECHGPDIQENDVRLDTLDLEGAGIGGTAIFDRVIRVLKSRQMPPTGESHPDDRERRLMISWFEERLIAHSGNEDRSLETMPNRRLTVEEYNFTMQHLFGVDAEFSDLLPADAISETGYRNSADRLGITSLQVEAYLDSARRAVDRYVRIGEVTQPSLRYHIELEELFYSTAVRYETRKRAPQPISREAFAQRRNANQASAPTFVDPLGPKLPGGYSEEEKLRAAIPKLNQQYVALSERLPIGELIVRVRAAGTAGRDGRFPRMRLEAGITLGDGCSMDKRVLDEIDITASVDAPATYEFRIRLEDVPSKGRLSDKDSFDRLSVFDMDQLFISNISCNEHAIFDRGRGAYADPATGSDAIKDQLQGMADDRVNFLHLDCIEVEMLPGVGPGNEPYRWTLATDEIGKGKNDEAVVREFLGRFMRDAHRRPLAEQELNGKLRLYRELRARDYSLEESLRECLAAVLVSPSFLFLEPSTIDGAYSNRESSESHRLASRLSYLLWLSPPDRQLMERAEDGSLLRRGVLRGEAERLLSDSRSRRFLESFSRGWLRLDRFDNVAVDRQAYPRFDDDLASNSIRETQEYFIDVFESGANALDLIDSDYAILNDRLAAHYAIERVLTGKFQRVRLDQHSVRGGLLTQSAVLTMNSDGFDSHPIRRGVWLLDRLLGSPPPPPPPNVADIDESDPDFRGLTLRQRIERHREAESCRNCHAMIDPWGIAMENFDATGRWRDDVSQPGHGERAVDASVTLPGGPRISGIRDLKTYLREHRHDQFATALVDHLLTYTMGRRPDYADGKPVREIRKRFTESGYRLKELVLAIIDSPLFQRQRSHSNGDSSKTN